MKLTLCKVRERLGHQNPNTNSIVPGIFINIIKQDYERHSYATFKILHQSRPNCRKKLRSIGAKLIVIYEEK